MVTVKSHKLPPLTWRNTHGSEVPACHGLSAWLVEVLKPITESLPYHLNLTEELVEDLRHRQAQECTEQM